LCKCWALVLDTPVGSMPAFFDHHNGTFAKWTTARRFNAAACRSLRSTQG
jgi:hypothetical protein